MIMPITFTLTELNMLRECPEVLRIVAAWRDVNQENADTIGLDTCGDRNRARVLRMAATELEKNY